MNLSREHYLPSPLTLRPESLPRKPRRADSSTPTATRISARRLVRSVGAGRSLAVKRKLVLRCTKRLDVGHLAAHSSSTSLTVAVSLRAWVWWAASLAALRASALRAVLRARPLSGAAVLSFFLRGRAIRERRRSTMSMPCTDDATSWNLSPCLDSLGKIRPCLELPESTSGEPMAYCPVCWPAERVCLEDDKTVIECDISGIAWQVYEICESTEKCVNGECSSDWRFEK